MTRLTQEQLDQGYRYAIVNQNKEVLVQLPWHSSKEDAEKYFQIIVQPQRTDCSLILRIFEEHVLDTEKPTEDVWDREQSDYAEARCLSLWTTKAIAMLRRAGLIEEPISRRWTHWLETFDLAEYKPLHLTRAKTLKRVLALVASHGQFTQDDMIALRNGFLAE